MAGHLFYDVVVAGAGVAGCYVARRLAESGLRVALVERKEKSRIGEKVCGDAISKSYFVELGLELPGSREIEGIIRRMEIYSPSEKYVLVLQGEGYELNRKAFGQRLLREALNAGVELYHFHHVLSPIISEGFVKGIVVRDLRDNVIKRISANVTVDATGIASAIRRKLPSSWPVSEKLSLEDASIAYREIRVDVQVDNPTSIKIFLNQEASPGGYWWFFPKGENKANIGLGVQGVPNHPNPRNLFYKHIAIRAELASSKVVEAGGGIVPTRRSLKTFVANGFVTIGDAALTANPVHGGGMGAALKSAYAAYMAITEAFEMGDYSINGLWKTNVIYNKLYGAKQASLDLMRMFMQRLSNDDLEFVMRERIVTGEELSATSSEGLLKYSIVEKGIKLFKLIRKPSLLSKLRLLAKYMSEVKALYDNYPKRPEGFEKWSNDVERAFSEFASIL